MTPKEQVTHILNALKHPFDTRIVAIASDDNRRTLGIRSPYNSGYISELKETISSSERSWNPETRTWFVEPHHYNTIMSLCLRYFSLANIRESNTSGLSDLTSPVKPKVEKTNISLEAIKALNVVHSNETEDLVYVIVLAWKNNQITSEKALETIDKLYN